VDILIRYDGIWSLYGLALANVCLAREVSGFWRWESAEDLFGSLGILVRDDEIAR